MEITLNKKSNTEGVIKIKLSQGDYQPHVEEKVKEYSRKANIKGFRQGKVPAGVIKKMFGKSLLVDEINQVLSNQLQGYIKDNNLKILGEPLPDLEKSRDIDWDNQKDFEFDYQVGLLDEFSYDLSAKVKVKSYPIEVDKKVIDETVEDLKQRFGEASEPETSEAGDNLYGELRSKDEDAGGLFGNAEGGFKKENAFIATDKVEKKEQKKFAGLKVDDEVEFEINKLFSDDILTGQLLGISPEEAKKAKGKYILKIKSISRIAPATVNQQLFDQVFGKDAVATEEAFIEKIKETIGENYKRESEHFLDHNIEDVFIKNTEINLPDDFLKLWLKSTSQGQVTDEVLEKEFDAYRRGLKWDLIKNRIADDNKITVEADEVRNRAKDMIIGQFGGQAFAAQLADRMDAIADNYLQSENGKNFMQLYGQIRGEKILAFIKEKIKIDEKKVSVDEFKKIVEEHTH